MYGQQCFRIVELSSASWAHLWRDMLHVQSGSPPQWNCYETSTQSSPRVMTQFSHLGTMNTALLTPKAHSEEQFISNYKMHWKCKCWVIILTNKSTLVFPTSSLRPHRREWRCRNRKDHWPEQTRTNHSLLAKHRFHLHSFPAQQLHNFCI